MKSTLLYEMNKLETFNGIHELRVIELFTWFTGF